MERKNGFGCATPVVPASDVDASVDFYVRLLGFEEQFRHGEPAEYAGIARDLATVHFFRCTEPKIAEWTAFRIRVDDLDALFAQCAAAGIVHASGALTERPWGLRDFSVVDPAGVLVTFWHELDRA